MKSKINIEKDIDLWLSEVGLWRLMKVVKKYKLPIIREILMYAKCKLPVVTK